MAETGLTKRQQVNEHNFIHETTVEWERVSVAVQKASDKCEILISSTESDNG